jgi:hypothetical protein
VLGVVRGEAVLGDDEFAPVRRHRIPLLLRALGVRDGDVAVPADRGDHRDGGAGVPRGGRDERVARLELAVALGAVDNVLRDPVLDGSARIQVLRLGQNLDPLRLRHPAQVEQGGVADDRRGAHLAAAVIALQLRYDRTHDGEGARREALCGSPNGRRGKKRLVSSGLVRYRFFRADCTETRVSKFVKVKKSRTRHFPIHFSRAGD